MTKEKQAMERVRRIPATETGEPDYSDVAVAEKALVRYGYQLEFSQILAAVLLELRDDGAEETATAFKLFRKIAGIVRKPRTPKAS